MQLKHIITLLLEFVSNHEVHRDTVLVSAIHEKHAKSIPIRDTFVMC